MIPLKTLGTDELSGIVEKYPWFAAARKELCERLAKPTEAALYVCSRATLSRTSEISAETVSSVIRSAPEKKVFARGGDYFSQEDYDSVRGAALSFTPAEKTSEESPSGEVLSEDLYTETIAEVYVQQGYYTEAKAIYSRLSLRYPEKNAYFAALIEKMDQEIKN